MGYPRHFIGTRCFPCAHHERTEARSYPPDPRTDTHQQSFLGYHATGHDISHSHGDCSRAGTDYTGSGGNPQNDAEHSSRKNHQ